MLMESRVSMDKLSTPVLCNNSGFYQKQISAKIGTDYML